MPTVTLTTDASNGTRIAGGVARKIGIYPATATASAAQVKAHIIEYLNGLAQDHERLSAQEAWAAAATPVVQT